MITEKYVLAIQEIKSIFENQDAVGDTIFDLLKCFNPLKLCRSLGVCKLMGYSLPSLVVTMMMFPLMLVKTVRGFITSNFRLTKARKDAFFRILNNEKMDWRKMLITAAKQFLSMTPEVDSAPTPTCGIIDDTTLTKTGEKIEGIGRIFDHCLRKCVLGFKCQVYSFWDGKSIYPLDFTLHAEVGRNRKRPFGMTKKKLKERFNKSRSAKSHGSKRFKELTVDKISAALAVIKRAAKHGFVPQYLLADSWYASEKFICGVRKIKQGAIHFLGRVRLDKRRYDYQGEKYNAQELKRVLKSKSKRCRKLKATYIEAVVEYKDVGKVKLFFSRYSHHGKWRLTLTTDRSLSYVKAMEIYSVRWSIETLFKECKQHLNLGKCQSNDFDAQIAETTLSLVLFTMLSFYKRIHSYETMGILFAKLKDQLIEATIAERLWLLLTRVLLKLVELFEIDPMEHFKKLINEDELHLELQTISGLLPSIESGGMS